MTDSHNRDLADQGSLARKRMESFDTFFLYYWPRLVRFLWSQASSRSTAEEVAAETMATVWDHWDELGAYQRPDSWTFKVAIRKLRRVEARAREIEMLEERSLDWADQFITVGPEAETDANSDISIMTGELTRLPRRQGQVLALALDGYQPVEIADILGITPNAARVHLHHARSAVRSRLRSVEITPRDREALASWVRKTSIRTGLAQQTGRAQKARIALLAVEGSGTKEIARRTVRQRDKRKEQR